MQLTEHQLTTHLLTEGQKSMKKLNLVEGRLLNGPVARHSTMGDCSFSVAAARVCNSLPSDITSATSLLAFRRVLKTELFCHSFSDNYLVFLHCRSTF